MVSAAALPAQRSCEHQIRQGDDGHNARDGILPSVSSVIALALLATKMSAIGMNLKGGKQWENSRSAAAPALERPGGASIHPRILNFFCDSRSCCLWLLPRLARCHDPTLALNTLPPPAPLRMAFLR